jgi:hypothetical protein
LSRLTPPARSYKEAASYFPRRLLSFQELVKSGMTIAPREPSFHILGKAAAAPPAAKPRGPGKRKG